MHASLDAKRSPFSSQQTLKKLSLAQSMIENQQSWAFKSKSDKVAIYKDEEKRIRLLYGSKQNLKYKIKLNDQILEPGEGQNSPTGRGNVKLGSMVDPNPVMKAIQSKLKTKQQQNDIFGTANKLDLGPGDYEPKKAVTQKKSPVPDFRGTAHKEPSYAERMQQDNKKIRQFDGSASCIKMDPKPLKCAPLEERQTVPVFGDEPGRKAAAVFNSQNGRFSGSPNENPGPGQYVNSTNQPNYIIKGPTQSTFGSNVERNNLIHRDVSKSPFKNPTNLDNPSPAQYAPKLHEAGAMPPSPGRGSLPAANSPSSNLALDIQDQGATPKPTSTYQSHVPRDFLASVSKEQRINPGPGSYLHDQLMKDKVKALSY